DTPRLELRSRGVPTIRAAQRCTQSETTLGEVQTVANGSTYAVILHPSHQRLIDTALIEQILEQPSYRIVSDGCDDRRIEAETTLQAAGNVVFAATLGAFKGPRGPNAPCATSEAQHHLAKPTPI